MNFKCMIGLHDWETYSVKSGSTIKNEVLRETNKGRPPIGVEWHPDKQYVKKICLRCKKKVDEITPQREKAYAKYNESLRRIRLSKKLLKKGDYK